ncbi:MucBP domain-containing protein [Lactiplantibacillus xiangfangensis]|nr:MucBP domain-containing protein [Lactiplantibacillus xiangfangensis]
MLTKRHPGTQWTGLGLLLLSAGVMTLTAQSAQATTFTTPLSLANSVTQPHPMASLPGTSTLLDLTTPATKEDPITGQFGTSNWSLQDGTLTIGPGDFANNAVNSSPWNDYRALITKIEITGPVTLNTTANALFANFPKLTQIDGLEKVDTSKTTDMSSLFGYNPNLKSVPGIEYWNTSNVKNISYLFMTTGLAGTLDLSHWDVSSLNRTTLAFARTGTSQFKRLDLSGWNFKSPNTSLALFLQELADIDLDTSDWKNTHNISDMQYMFYYSWVSKVDISSFDMRHLPTSSNGTRKMLSNNENLKEIKLGPNSKLTGTNLTQVPDNNKYTGYWQNVGDGTARQPKGDLVLTTNQLVARYDGIQTPATDTFVWQRHAGEPVTVNYVDQADPSQVIQPTDTLTGAIDDPFTVTPPTIDGYTYRGTQGNGSLTGTFSTTAQDITLLYAKQAQVTVNYLDEAGNVIAPAQKKTGDVGTTYTIDQLAIPGYDYVAGDLQGIFTEAPQTVNLTYRAIPTEGSITVNYLDDEGHTIEAPTTMTGKIGSAYTITPPTISGYTYQSGQLSGTFTATNQSVTLIYQRNVVHGTVTVRYVDEQDHELAEPTTLTGPVNSEYTIEKIAIPGHTFLTGELTGIFTATDKAVTLTYRKEPLAQGTVTVNYQDTAGKSLAPSQTLSGDVATPFTISQLTIDGYTYQHADGPLTGVFTKTPQTVTLIYQATPEPQGQVNVKYQTCDGQTLADDTQLTGTIGESYTITPPTFTNYHFQHASDQLTGTFSVTTPTITLIYQKDAVANGQVTVNYLDLNGQPIAPKATLTGAIDTAYTTTVKQIAGYKYIKTTGAPTGTFTAEAQTVNYYYQQETTDVDQRQLTGQDFTMIVNGPTPTATDFKASAQDKNGQSLPVEVDLTQAQLDQVGTYPVTLRTSDGQTLIVHLHVRAAPDGGDNGDDDNDGGHATEPPVLPTDPAGEPDLVKPDQPGISKTEVPKTMSPIPTSPIETATTERVQAKATQDEVLPATNEQRTRWVAVTGLIGLLGLGLALFKRFKS